MAELEFERIFFLADARANVLNHDSHRIKIQFQVLLLYGRNKIVEIFCRWKVYLSFSVEGVADDFSILLYPGPVWQNLRRVHAGPV